MKSKFTKILISCLLLFAFLVSGVACGGSDPSGGAITSEQGYTYAKTDHFDYEGTHIRNIEESSTDLVKDGKSDYVLVLPQNLNKEVLRLKDDFLLLFKKATGVTLPVKRDVVVANDWDESKKYISVGDNLLVKKANIPESEYSIESIKNEGIRIITKGNTQFILGGDWAGEINAMYEFLTIYFNFDAYSRSSISLDTGITNLKLKNIDLTEVPDVNYYVGDSENYRYSLAAQPWDKYSLGAEYVNEEVKASPNRLKLHYTQSMWIPIHPTFTDTGTVNGFHNLKYLIPSGSEYEIPDYIWKYKDDVGFYNETPFINANSKMYPDAGGSQFCFSAHNDQDVYDDMIDICAAKIIYSLIVHSKSYNFRYATITVEDSWDVCNCAECTRQMALYGSSGMTIRFANKVGEIVKKWLNIQKDENAEYHHAYREGFKILIFGYHRDTEPPVNETVNADGSITFTPKDPSVVFSDMTAIWLVEDNNYGHLAPYDTLHGNFTEKYLPGWKAVEGPEGGQFFWYNSPSTSSRDYAYDDLSQYNGEFWEMMAHYGYEGVFMDHFARSTDMSGWHNLTSYVCSKLRWNCHLDTEELIKKYMQGMFYEAADDMYKIFQDTRLYYTNIRANSKDHMNHTIISKREFYPYPVIEGWINMFESAKEKIAHYKDTNPDLYIAIKTRIDIEEAGEVCKVLTFYDQEGSRPFSREKLNQYRDFLTNLIELCPNMNWQGTLIQNYL